MRGQKAQHAEETTNRWLERVEAEEDGPERDGAAPDGTGLKERSVREERVLYEAGPRIGKGEIPF